MRRFNSDPRLQFLSWRIDAIAVERLDPKPLNVRATGPPQLRCLPSCPTIWFLGGRHSVAAVFPSGADGAVPSKSSRRRVFGQPRRRKWPHGSGMRLWRQLQRTRCAFSSVEPTATSASVPQRLPRAAPRPQTTVESPAGRPQRPHQSAASSGSRSMRH
jgi:hypothetical protein